MEAAIDRKLAGIFDKLEEVYFEIHNSRQRILGFTSYLDSLEASTLQLAMQRCSNLDDYEGQYSRTKANTQKSSDWQNAKKKVDFEKQQDHFRHPVEFYITYNPNLKVSASQRVHHHPSE